MAGYTRQSVADITANAVIKAAPVNAEYNSIRDAFIHATGHKHDGTSNEGAFVPLIADVDALNKVVIDTTNNRIGFFSQVGSGTVEQLRIQDGAFVPVSDDDIDLGAAGAEFKNLYIDGIGYIDTLAVHENATIAGTLGVTGLSTLASVDINGGNIDAVQIGAASPSTVVGTTVSATNFVGPIAGAVTGNVTGNLGGNVTGNVVGNVTGNVTAGSGASAFNNVTINGSLDMNAGTSATITGLSNPVQGSDAATKTYVDSKVAAVIQSAPAALDTLNELAAALGDDANYASTTTAALATKLPKAGGTMTGAIAMGTSKITGLGTPTAGTDAATKAYVDGPSGAGAKLNLSGGTMSGVLALGSNKITGVANPTQAQDAATKAYIDTTFGSTTAAATSAGNAATSATAGANSATASANSATASANSASGASTSASNSAASLASFVGQYVAQASAPSSPDAGDLWFDTNAGIMKVYNGSGFVNAGSSVNGVENSVQHTATAGQTSFTATYDAGFLQVFLNGIRLDAADYTATNGSTVVLDAGATVSDTVFIHSFGTFELADHYTKVASDARFAPASGGVLATNAMPKAGGAFTGAVTTNSTIDGRDVAADGVLATNALPKSGGTMSGAIDMGSNNITTTGKMLYANMYNSVGDLPSASTYHGMFAHVHGTGKGYYAHAGNWVELGNQTDLSSATTTAGAALPKAGGAMTGAITTNSTFDGVDIATRDGVLTATTATANAALPKAGGALTGALTTNSTIDGVDIATRDGILTSTTTTANAAQVPPTITGTNVTAVNASYHIASAGGITITLPASPSAGNYVTIKDGTGAAATTTFTVARNGSNIASSGTDLVFDKNFAQIVMTYINSTIGWSI